MVILSTIDFFLGDFSAGVLSLATWKEEAILYLSLNYLQYQSQCFPNSHLHQIHLAAGKNAYS